MEEIFTIPEVAKYLKMSKSKLYYLVQRNQIPYVRIGRNVRIRESDLIEWIEANCIKYAVNDLRVILPGLR